MGNEGEDDEDDDDDDEGGDNEGVVERRKQKQQANGKHLVAPMSVQPSRKATMSMDGFRRLWNA